MTNSRKLPEVPTVPGCTKLEEAVNLNFEAARSASSRGEAVALVRFMEMSNEDYSKILGSIPEKYIAELGTSWLTNMNTHDLELMFPRGKYTVTFFVLNFAIGGKCHASLIRDNQWKEFLEEGGFLNFLITNEEGKSFLGRRGAPVGGMASMFSERVRSELSFEVDGIGDFGPAKLTEQIRQGTAEVMRNLKKWRAELVN